MNTEIFKKRNYKQVIKKDKKLQQEILEIIQWTNDIDEAAFCIKNNITQMPICPICNINKCEFKKKSDGTMKYNSGCCTAHSKIQSYREKYGVDNPSQSDSIKAKKKITTIKNYGVEHNSQSPNIKKKKKQTTLKNYGVESPLQNREVMNKVKKTNLKKYGVEFPLQNQDVLEKVKSTNIKKYGVSNPQQYEKIRNKTIETNIVEYGGITPMSSIKVRQKNRNHYIQTFFEKKLNSLKYIVTPLFDICSYSTTEQNYKWQCNVCGNEFESHLKDGRIPRCYECYPSCNTGISKGEIELFNSIDFKSKIQSDKHILEGKELDIYIPDKKIAIEFNGIYWHSELNGKDKNYHLSKTEQCLEKGIQLIHIFETEWYEKKEIVLSIINAKLGKYEKRIYARQCQIKEISSKEKNVFLEENHLQGNDTSSVKLGLFYNDELVSLMTFGNSRYNKNYQYEMHRFCNKLGYQIIGGASKLFTHFINNKKPTSIITYADRRYSDGTFYEKIGFEKKGVTSPNHFYFKGNSKLMSRIGWQKHKLNEKLDNFDSKLTAWENLQLNGYDRIWDCGNFVFEWRN